MIEEKNQPSSERSNRKGHKDNSNQLSGINELFCTIFDTESTASFCGGHDSDCTEVTSHLIATFRVKHFI